MFCYHIQLVSCLKCFHEHILVHCLAVMLIRKFARSIFACLKTTFLLLKEHLYSAEILQMHHTFVTLLPDTLQRG